MISSIGATGSGTVSGLSGQTQRGEGVQQTARSGAAIEDRTRVSTTVGQIASQGAPVDVDRVSSIKAAIKAGTYRIDPNAIAQKMIATDMGTNL